MEWNDIISPKDPKVAVMWNQSHLTASKERWPDCNKLPYWDFRDFRMLGTPWFWEKDNGFQTIFHGIRVRGSLLVGLVACFEALFEAGQFRWHRLAAPVLPGSLLWGLRSRINNTSTILVAIALGLRFLVVFFLIGWFTTLYHVFTLKVWSNTSRLFNTFDDRHYEWHTFKDIPDPSSDYTMLNLSTTYTGCLRVTIGILSADKKVPNDNAEFIPTRKKHGRFHSWWPARSDYLRLVKLHISFIWQVLTMGNLARVDCWFRSFGETSSLWG